MKNTIKNNLFNKRQLSYLSENSIRSTWERVGKEEAKTLVDLSLGNPSTLFPPQELIEQLIKILKRPIPIGFFSYMDNAGYPKTRIAIAKDLVRLKLFPRGLNKNHIIMTAGASAAINCTLLALLNPKDEVILLSPFFVDYPKYILNFSAKPCVVSLKPPLFDLDINLIQEAINKKTKAIIINSPNNPTGKVYSKEKLDELVKLLRRKSKEFKHPIYLISDEVYREIIYDKNKYFSPCTNYEYSIMVYSYSKSLNIPGERIGYAAIHPLMKNSETLFQLIKFSNRVLGFTNAPALIQKVIPKLLPLKLNDKYYQKQRDKLALNLKKAGFKFQIPEGAFYFFVRFPTPDQDKFTTEAKLDKLYFVDSKPFGVSGYFRVAYCVTEQKIDLACKKFLNLGKRFNNS